MMAWRQRLISAISSKCLLPDTTKNSSPGKFSLHQGASSVKTKNEIPKETIAKCMKELAQITVTAPIHLNDVILENIAGTKVTVIATKQVDKLK